MEKETFIIEDYDKKGAFCGVSARACRNTWYTDLVLLRKSRTVYFQLWCRR